MWHRFARAQWRPRFPDALSSTMMTCVDDAWLSALDIQLLPYCWRNGFRHVIGFNGHVYAQICTGRLSVPPSQKREHKGDIVDF